MQSFINGDGQEVELPEVITDGIGNSFDVIIYDLPMYWACYLINGDESGLEDGEQATIDAWLEAEDSPWFVDVGESFFSWRNDATSLGGDVCQYVAHVKRGEG